MSNISTTSSSAKENNADNVDLSLVYSNFEFLKDRLILQRNLDADFTNPKNIPEYSSKVEPFLSWLKKHNFISANYFLFGDTGGVHKLSNTPNETPKYLNLELQLNITSCIPFHQINQNDIERISKKLEAYNVRHRQGLMHAVSAQTKYQQKLTAGPAFSR